LRRNASSILICHHVGYNFFSVGNANPLQLDSFLFAASKIQLPPFGRQQISLNYSAVVLGEIDVTFIIPQNGFHEVFAGF